MARKDLLKSLLEQSTEPTVETPQAASTSMMRRGKGAVGAISQSLNELQTRSIVEIEPDLIGADGPQDRLDTDSAEDASLLSSIEEYGQQVPILVRKDPEAEGRFLVVYGRRRLAALKALGQPVKAIIRDLDDQTAVLAQGQENSQRRNLSFIEKAKFASEMEKVGYSRKVICDALALDKTEISRLLKVIDLVPDQWILAIGSAPSVGRDRWMKLGEMIGLADASSQELKFDTDGLKSDERFLQAFESWEAELKPAIPNKPAKKSEPETLLGAGGEPIGTIKRTPRKISFEFYARGNEGFEDWLAEQLPDLHEKFKQEKS